MKFEIEDKPQWLIDLVEYDDLYEKLTTLAGTTQGVRVFLEGRSYHSLVNSLRNRLKCDTERRDVFYVGSLRDKDTDSVLITMDAVKS